MNKSGLEWKVGLFMVISLAFAGGLIMKFSKSTSVFSHAYQLILVTSNVGGIRPGATVLVAGVQVGTVEQIDLDESGTNVMMQVKVQSRYKIHRDARFTIEQAGFLGDQYISIVPGGNRESELRPGETVRCEEPFNLQEVARSAAGLIRRVDQTAARLNVAVGRIDRTILSEDTLTNFTGAVRNFRTASERALATLQGVDNLVQTNSPGLNMAITNLVQFSEQLEAVTAELQLAVATNRVEITSAIKNLQTSTIQVNGLLDDLQAGKGLVGSLLKDNQLRQDFSVTMSNLTVVSSNLSAHGLLWKPKAQRVHPYPNPIYPGKDPSR